MGSSLSAMLVYGYDLGGDGGAWKLREADEYGRLPEIGWHTPGRDLGDDAEDRLLAVITGFTETWETRVDDHYRARRREAEARLGVEIAWYGLSDHPALVLAAHVVNFDQSGPVDLAELHAHPDRAKWDAALATAVAALGLTPSQGDPGWILAASCECE